MDIQLIKSEFKKFNKYYKEKNIKLSILSLEKILEENPKQIEAIFFLATIYLQNKNFIESKKLYLKFIKMNPNNSSVYYNLGLVNYNLDILDDAIENFKKVLEIKKDNTDALNNLAKIYKDMNQLKESKIYYEKCLSIEPHKKNACLGYSGLLFKLNDHINGLKYLQAGSGIVRFNKNNIEII